MKFYKSGNIINATILMLLLVTLLVLPICFCQYDGWKAFLIYFFPSILAIVILLHSDKMYINAKGISCFSSRKCIFFCAWENIKCFELEYHERSRCIDIVPIDTSKVEVHNYIFTVSEPNFYFVLTRKSRKIIQQFCPREELIAQLYPKRAKSKRQKKS